MQKIIILLLIIIYFYYILMMKKCGMKCIFIIFSLNDLHTCKDRITNATREDGRPFTNSWGLFPRNNTLTLHFNIEASRIYYYYFVISNCNIYDDCGSMGCQAPINLVDVNLTLINGNGKLKHLPEDEKNLYTLYLVLLIIYIFLTVYGITLCIRLFKREYFIIILVYHILLLVF